MRLLFLSLGLLRERSKPSRFLPLVVALTAGGLLLRPRLGVVLRYPRLVLPLPGVCQIQRRVFTPARVCPFEGTRGGGV